MREQRMQLHLIIRCNLPRGFQKLLPGLVNLSSFSSETTHKTMQTHETGLQYPAEASQKPSYRICEANTDGTEEGTYIPQSCLFGLSRPLWLVFEKLTGCFGKLRVCVSRI